MWTPVSEFGLNKSKKDGLQCHCKECVKVYKKQHCPEWDSVKITLNCMGILVSRHSRFEPVNTIPLEVLRMFADK